MVRWLGLMIIQVEQEWSVDHGGRLGFEPFVEDLEKCCGQVRGMGGGYELELLRMGWVRRSWGMDIHLDVSWAIARVDAGAATRNVGGTVRKGGQRNLPCTSWILRLVHSRPAAMIDRWTIWVDNENVSSSGLPFA